MHDFSREIDAALGSEKPIPKDDVLKWIGAAGDDLRTLAKLCRLTGAGYYRIEPELGKDPTCTLVQRYLLECIRQNVEGNDEIESRFEACMSLVGWLNNLLDKGDCSEIIAGAARAITDLYLEREDAQYTIETSFLEHALETAALRPYFEYWSRDERLQEAWKLCLAWGEAHPDRMRTMLRQLRGRNGE